MTSPKKPPAPKPAAPTVEVAAKPVAAAESEPPAYSRAFEILVEKPNDIVGLLAYAKFKEHVREAALAGTPPDQIDRTLTPAIISAFRLAAEQMITEMLNEGIEAAAPDIQQSATMAALEANHREVISVIERERAHIEGHVTAKTGFVGAFLTNLLAWGASLIIVVIILYIADRKGVEQTVVDALQKPQVPQVDK